MISYVYGQHAQCYMQLTVSDPSGGSLTIQALNDSLVKMVQSRIGNTSSCVYYSQGAEFCGYSIVSMSSKDNHFQHTTPVHHYVDDINFSEWTQSGSNVVVQADSKSEPTSIGDYDTNFCNIFNLFRNGNAHKMNYDLKFKYTSCTSFHHPNTDNGYDAAYQQCDTY